MQETLELLGLSPNEAKIYRALVERGELSVSDISRHTGIHRRNIYDTVERLLEKGLCYPAFSKKEAMYMAVDPEKLNELVAEQQKKLDGIMPTLRKHFLDQVADEEVYIYRGIEGQKNIWRDVLRVGEPSYFIGAKAAWFDPRLRIAREKFFREANKKKLKFSQLFDHQASIAKNFPIYFPGLLEYRVLPEKYATISSIHIFGPYVVTYTGLEQVGELDNDVVFFIMKSPQLAESYRTWFQALWDGVGKPKKKSK